jgi:hypothetical protein
VDGRDLSIPGAARGLSSIIKLYHNCLVFSFVYLELILM